MKHFMRKLPLRRLTALLLGILLVPALLPVQASFADEPGGGETETPAKPDMRVIATLVDEQQYLEVGLNIDSKEGGTFQSAAVLLTYDPAVLTPVTWGGTAQEVTVPTVEESALAWDQTKLLPTKGADEMSGKLSSAIGVQGKDRGYLFLSAETAMPMPLRQGQPVGDTPEGAPTATTNGHPVNCLAKTETATEQTVVVRFRVNAKPPQGGEEPGTRELQGYTLAELVSSLDLVSAEDGAISSFPLSGSAGTSYLADNSSIETTGFETETNLSFVWILDGVSVNTAGTSPSGPSGYSLLFHLLGGSVYRITDAVPPTEEGGAETPATEELLDTAEVFKTITELKAGDAATLPVIPLEAGQHLEFRRDTVTATSLTFLDVENQTYTLNTDGTWTKPTTGDTPETITTLTMPDKSVALAARWGNPPANPNDFFPVVFYDWDGVTMLGSKIVPKTDNVTEQEALIATALTEMQVQLSATDEMLAGALWNADESLPLTNKKGYTFGKWIDSDAKDANGNEVYTSYGNAVSVISGSDLVIIPEPDGHVFSTKDYEKGIILKAAYQSNTDLDPLDTASKRSYTVEYKKYLQFGKSNDVGITVSIKRENDQGQGVHRVREAGLRVAMDFVLDGGTTTTVYSLVRLTNKDEQTVQIAVNNTVAAVRAEVIDLCGVKSMTGTSNWAGEATNRSVVPSAVPGGDHTDIGFVLLGLVGYFNDTVNSALLAGDTGELIRTNKSVYGIHSIITATEYSKAGFNLDTVKNAASTSALNRRRGAIANIFEAYESLPTERRDAGLTWDEMQEAITYGITWDAGTGTWVRKP